MALPLQYQTSGAVSNALPHPSPIVTQHDRDGHAVLRSNVSFNGDVDLQGWNQDGRELSFHNNDGKGSRNGNSNGNNNSNKSYHYSYPTGGLDSDLSQSMLNGSQGTSMVMGALGGSDTSGFTGHAEHSTRHDERTLAMQDVRAMLLRSQATLRAAMQERSLLDNTSNSANRSINRNMSENFDHDNRIRQLQLQQQQQQQHFTAMVPDADMDLGRSRMVDDTMEFMPHVPAPGVQRTVQRACKRRWFVAWRRFVHSDVCICGRGQYHSGMTGSGAGSSVQQSVGFRTGRGGAGRERSAVYAQFNIGQCRRSITLTLRYLRQWRAITQQRPRLSQLTSGIARARTVRALTAWRTTTLTAKAKQQYWLRVGVLSLRAWQVGTLKRHRANAERLLASAVGKMAARRRNSTLSSILEAWRRRIEELSGTFHHASRSHGGGGGRSPTKSPNASTVTGTRRYSNAGGAQPRRVFRYESDLYDDDNDDRDVFFAGGGGGNGVGGSNAHRVFYNDDGIVTDTETETGGTDGDGDEVDVVALRRVSMSTAPSMQALLSGSTTAATLASPPRPTIAAAINSGTTNIAATRTLLPTGRAPLSSSPPPPRGRAMSLASSSIMGGLVGPHGPIAPAKAIATSVKGTAQTMPTAAKTVPTAAKTLLPPAQTVPTEAPMRPSNQTTVASGLLRMALGDGVATPTMQRTPTSPPTSTTATTATTATTLAPQTAVHDTMDKPRDGEGNKTKSSGDQRTRKADLKLLSRTFASWRLFEDSDDDVPP